MYQDPFDEYKNKCTKECKKKKAPYVGDAIYVPSQYYLSHGRDDFKGGKAKIIAVYHLPNSNHFVTINSRPNAQIAWEGNLKKNKKN